MLIKAFDRIRRGLARTRQSLADRLSEVLGSRRKVDEELLEELEEILLEADVGVATCMEIIDGLRGEIRCLNFQCLLRLVLIGEY